jgi:hypothetical protein
MKWLRGIFVYFLSVGFLLCLVGISLATSLDVSLTHQTKIENWINQSTLYANIESSIVSQAQKSIENNVAGGSSISSSTVQQAAKSAFSQVFLQKAVHSVLNSNYLWLEGKTTTPDFKVDVSGAKLQFATQIADEAVLTHFNNLPACTTTQSLQLQSANPLLLSCRPTGISAASVATQVTQQLANSSDFLSTPVITASTINLNGSKNGTVYYTRFSRAPTIYQAIQKLPLILGIASAVLLLAVIYCSRSRRRGIRRAGFVLLLAGILLIADKLVADFGFNQVKDRLFNGFNNSQIQQSVTSVAHNLESELTKINLWFGVAYVLLAVILFSGLIATRKPRKKRPAIADKPDKQPQIQKDNPALNRLRSQPTTDVLAPTPRPRQAVTTPASAQHDQKKPSRPRPPRLIQ